MTDEDDEDDDGSGGTNARKMLRLTKAQSAILEESFKHRNYFNPQSCRTLSTFLPSVFNLVEMKRKARSNMLEFNGGWASTHVIGFLLSIGKDTSKKLSEYDVANIIKEYVRDKELINFTGKNKKVDCDDKLLALFGKKQILWANIQDLLDRHFYENQYVCSTEGESHNVDSDEGSSFQMQNVPEPPKTGLAAIVPENIKSVYLKRSLLQELTKVPESFLDKVVGSYVRIKSNLNDNLLKKNSHQLQQVIGFSSKADNSEIHLQLVNYYKDVPLHLLSEEDFTVDECVDLAERFKAGYFERPTVEELEAKAKILHEDITIHCISKEISLLQIQIDVANEKGWRRELYAYLERKQRLEKPAEREKLLSKIPKVIGEIESTGTALENVEVDSIDSNRNNDKALQRIKLIWRYVDEKGKVQGPVSLNALKRWYDNGFFGENWILGKTDQTPTEAHMLIDVLHRNFCSGHCK